MTIWNDGSVNKTTTYSYGNRNQMTSNTGYYFSGTADTGSMTLTWDNKGNLLERDWGSSNSEITYQWNADNRLVTATTRSGIDPEAIRSQVTYAYDSEGRRLLKRGPYDPMDLGRPAETRERFFFKGLTEEIKKVSVANAHSDAAFEFNEKADGASATAWYATSGSVTTGTDTIQRSSVVQFNGTSKKATLTIGDTDANDQNPNGTAWNAAERVASFWYFGYFGEIEVFVTTTSGSKTLTYVQGTGTNTHTSGNAIVYLGSTMAATSVWQRFERNIEQDYEAAATGYSFTQIDGIRFWPDVAGASNYDFSIDMLRLSNCQTVEVNVVGPGSVGHILRHRRIDPATYAATDRWFHYDQVGSVMSETDGSGALAQTHWQDAWGNTMASWSTGLWGGDQDGWHHNMKEYDGEAGAVYMYQRWYSSQLAVFAARAPYSVSVEHPYGTFEGNPLGKVDPAGERPANAQDKVIASVSKPINSSTTASCRIYCDTDTHVGYSARCVCEKAGNSSWDMKVRGCLANLHLRGVDSWEAHKICYETATDIYGPVAYTTQVYDIGFSANAECFVGFNIRRGFEGLRRTILEYGHQGTLPSW